MLENQYPLKYSFKSHPPPSFGLKNSSIVYDLQDNPIFLPALPNMSLGHNIWAIQFWQYPWMGFIIILPSHQFIRDTRCKRKERTQPSGTHTVSSFWKSPSEDNQHAKHRRMILKAKNVEIPKILSCKNIVCIIWYVCASGA